MKYRRKAFGPGRKRNREQLAIDIADSILRKHDAGINATPNEYTNDSELMGMVNRLLGWHKRS